MRLEMRLAALEERQRQRYSGQCPDCYGRTGIILTDQMDDDDDTLASSEAVPCDRCGWKPMQIVIVRNPDDGRNKPQDIDDLSERVGL